MRCLVSNHLNILRQKYNFFPKSVKGLGVWQYRDLRRLSWMKGQLACFRLVDTYISGTMSQLQNLYVPMHNWYQTHHSPRVRQMLLKETPRFQQIKNNTSQLSIEEQTALIEGDSGAKTKPSQNRRGRGKKGRQAAAITTSRRVNAVVQGSHSRGTQQTTSTTTTTITTSTAATTTTQSIAPSLMMKMQTLIAELRRQISPDSAPQLRMAYGHSEMFLRLVALQSVISDNSVC